MTSDSPDCKHDAGQFEPVIDRNRCEGKEDCAAACPYLVFTMGTVAAAERRGLTLLGRAKGVIHRWRQSFPTDAEACHACGLCVTACPEKAIRLVRVR